MKQIKKLWWITLLRGIILLLLSIYIFKHPVDALVGIAIYVSISLLVTGLFQTGVAIATKNLSENWHWGLAIGLIDIFFGFILMTNPLLTATTLPFVVGFWIIVSGIMAFVDAFQYRKEGVSLWWLGMLGGILSVLIGYTITSNLTIGTLVITTWIGLGFGLAGLINILIGVKLKSI